MFFFSLLVGVALKSSSSVTLSGLESCKNHPQFSWVAVREIRYVGFSSSRRVHRRVISVTIVQIRMFLVSYMQLSSVVSVYSSSMKSMQRDSMNETSCVVLGWNEKLRTGGKLHNVLTPEKARSCPGYQADQG